MNNGHAKTTYGGPSTNENGFNRPAIISLYTVRSATQITRLSAVHDEKRTTGNTQRFMDCVEYPMAKRRARCKLKQDRALPQNSYLGETIHYYIGCVLKLTYQALCPQSILGIARAKT